MRLRFIKVRSLHKRSQNADNTRDAVIGEKYTEKISHPYGMGRVFIESLYQGGTTVGKAPTTNDGPTKE